MFRIMFRTFVGCDFCMGVLRCQCERQESMIDIIKKI
jgi:hypothetical protein